MDSLLFTPAALLDFLSQIDELKDKDVSVTQSSENQITIQIGESTYNIDAGDATEVVVDEEVVETVEDANDEAYESLSESGEIDLDYDEREPVESGILKELAKSLLLGGMIRLSAKMLK